MTAVAPAEMVERIWARDATLWTGADEAKWLGWLDEPMRMREPHRRAAAVRRGRRRAGRDRHVRPARDGRLEPRAEVLRRDVRAATRFHVLDTTHPAAIRRADGAARPRRDAVHRLVQVRHDARDALAPRLLLGADRQARRVLRRDHRPGLRARGARAASAASSRVFDGEPTIGGRYSALSVVRDRPGRADGHRPRAAARARATRWPRPAAAPTGNPGLELGPRRSATAGSEGRDKVTINPNTGGFGLWAEQLLAESTGKDGKGLVPAPGRVARRARPPGAGGAAPDARTSSAQEFFRWEFATAVAGSILGINPFDQPNVQAAKDKTNEVLAAGGDPDVEPQGDARRAARARRSRATTSRSRRSSTRRARPSSSR